ncbi:CobW family GTP-binding protein [Vibrio nigripulchritudo]|uniref:CobW family GTP-binding protein n=1 Tax=Vibrio nigripulchritudo TaxID=28173 RepID=UPI00249206DF|nr:GTP-binding protein [Vibrio nigripulchritudo]BDU40184.1 GTPase [Vibrio nigripulchritudo]BDU45918.1 GTPase [Vibrio nigripulchritudo]
MVPTNIITGFLGVGKTTAILNLLKHKPEGESWAVLVNEFGEVGIDGALLTDQGALIKEVPGGCMCCTAGVPMSVGITALLRQKPDRLIIEPTGLGHPKQVVSTLTSDQYKDHIDLKATIALVDPRNLLDEKYTSNQNFVDQLDSADIIVANKADECSEDVIKHFEAWAKEREALSDYIVTSLGKINLSALDTDKQPTQPVEPKHSSTHSHSHHHAIDEPEFILEPGQAYIRKENKGQGYYSCGWIFGAEHLFDFDMLMSMLSDLTAERVKGVINTSKGCFAVNNANGVMSYNELSLEGFETRIEVIDSQLMPWDQLEMVLLKIAGMENYK